MEPDRTSLGSLKPGSIIRIKPKNYNMYYELILSGQIPECVIIELMDYNPKFTSYFLNRRKEQTSGT